MRDDIQFLKELQAELNTQNTDSQASPRFWTVGDYVWESCWEEQAEKFYIYIPNDGDAYDWEDYRNEELENNDHDLDEETMEVLRDTNNEESMLDWVRFYIDSGAYLVPMKKSHVIRKSTMFLTKDEAKRHIELNHYHYTSKAHTYAMTAWRAPKVERLLKILSEFDFDSLDNI